MRDLFISLPDPMWSHIPLTVQLDVGLEVLVLDQDDVRGEHHECPRDIPVLELGVALVRGPSRLEQQLEVPARRSQG